MDTACHRGKNRKYAANSKHVEHTGMLQRLYLRFLCVKKAVCLGIPDFAAYFRVVIPEVRGKNRDRPTRPQFCASATCGFVAENRVVLRGFRFFPALPENAALHRE